MRLPIALTLLAALGAAPMPVFAGPPAPARNDKGDPKVAARALAERGYALFEAGKYAEAIDTLEQAEQLFHAPTIVMALARAHAAAGKLVAARALFQRVIDEKLPVTAPFAFKEAQRVARTEILAIEKRIPMIRIVVRGAAGKPVKVGIDGVAIADWAPDRSVPVDPGTRRVTAATDGAAPATRSAEVMEGARVTVEIELSRAPVATVEVPPGAGARPWLLPSLMGFGIGAAGLGVGIATGVVTLNRAAALRDRCGDVCPPTAANKSDVAAANGMGIASTVGFALAGAGVVTGIVLAAVKPGKRPRTGTTSVDMGPGSIGVRGTF